MNDQEPKNSFRGKSSASEGLLGDFGKRYKSLLWNILLLIVGLYLVWITHSVLFNIIGFCVGGFLVLFALTELRLFDYNWAFAFLLRILRQR